MKRLPLCVLRTIGVLAVVSSSIPQAYAVKVWESTFDTTADGVVDLADNNEDKVMIGSVVDGRLQITTGDTTSAAVDKAGRPLMLDMDQMPVPIAGGDDHMSAQYKFRWSEVNEVETQAYEFAGFLGPLSAPTRQVMGGVIRHFKVGASDYYASLDIAVGSVGFTNFGYLASSSIYLGSNPTANDYELRVEYHGVDHLLRLKLLDNVGNLIGQNQADLDDLPGFNNAPPNTPAQEIGALSLTHLGWGDYLGNGGFRTTVWQVDSLAWWDEPQVPVTLVPNADYNDDGEVNAADYVVWRKNFGTTGTPGSLPGDGTSDNLLGIPDGKVDQFDYDFWKSRFGNPMGSSSGYVSSTATIPEPSTAILVLAALSALLSIRRSAI